ncbi:MAG: dienelactone hydrolase family protein [Anaerolineae bacterium]|nr:dienelactone hydrolase family protein [Anaerolineae bacterium]
MSTNILNYHQLKELQPAYGLWQLYAPEQSPYCFRTKNLAQAEAWQVRVRRALNEALGFQSLPPVELKPEKIEEVDKGDYVREKILLHTSPYTVMPVYLLIPKTGQQPLPVVVAFHGHGYGVKDIVGLWENGSERDIPDGIHKDFGVALCRKGFVVAAPEISCFGERQTDFSYLNPELGQTAPTTCDHAAKLAFHLGGTALGLRVFDGKRLVDYLETRPEVDVNRLGAMGLSGGGMHTFFSTSLDERIKACVISGYYSTFKDSILAMQHCTCNFVPGLAQFGEMYDLVGLIAPRPILIEAGSHDPIFPLEAVKRSVDIARNRVYRIFGCPEQVETDYFEGRHQINGVRAYDFLMEKLSG